MQCVTVSRSPYWLNSKQGLMKRITCAGQRHLKMQEHMLFMVSPDLKYMQRSHRSLKEKGGNLKVMSTWLPETTIPVLQRSIQISLTLRPKKRLARMPHIFSIFLPVFLPIQSWTHFLCLPYRSNQNWSNS